MNDTLILILLISVPLLLIILKHSRSRRELGKGFLETISETAYTFVKGMIKTTFKASKAAIKEEYKNKRYKKEKK